MSTVSHTPGPLHVEQDHSIHTASGHPIGAAWPFEHETPGGRHVLSISEEETAANATLWAAAPDLLAALRAIAEWKLPRANLNGEDVPYAAAFGSQGEKEYIRNLARIAITKATYIDKQQQPKRKTQ